MLRIAATLALVAVLWMPVPALAQAGCTFTLGFQTLHDQIPDTVGTCLENERVNPANGNVEQRTSNGLLVWSKNGNQTGFTNGGTTWVSRLGGLITIPVTQPGTNTNISPALSERCTVVARGYANVIVATHGGDSGGLYGTIYNRCAHFAVIAGDKGVTCFNAAMQGMMSDMPTYGQNKEAMAERMQQRMTLCL